MENIEINLLLEGIFNRYGNDFRRYMRSSISRRIHHRMHLERIPTVTALLDKVLHEPTFMQILANDFSIKVTEMFRNPSFFAAFRQEVVPCLREYPEIRIWHAGCATGEEAFSMAILMHEEGLANRTKIYATDMNEIAIGFAKEGRMPIRRMQDFTTNYIKAGGAKEFSEYYSADHRYASIHSWVIENITFAQHNLVTDRSFNEFHVILCRNVLIYFDITLQNRVHDLFYNSLVPHGFLGMGNKESLKLTQQKDEYEDFVGLERIFRKIK